MGVIVSLPARSTMNVQEEEARLSGNSDLVSLCDSIASYRSLEDAFAEQKAPPAPPSKVFPAAKRIPIVLASVLGLFFFFFPLLDNEFANRCFAMLVIVSTLWALEGVPLYITSLLIPLITVWFKILPDASGTAPLSASAAASAICEQFWSPTIFLFLGGFSIAAALEKYGLNRALVCMRSQVMGSVACS